MWGSWTFTPLRLCSSSVAQAPGECSFLKSPDDLQAPLPAPRGAQAVLLAVGLPEPYAFLSSVIRWWAAFSWHRNIGREEMPKLRSWHGGDCWRAGLEAPCLLPFSIRLHLASAFHGERRVNSRGLFFKTCCSSTCRGREVRAAQKQCGGPGVRTVTPSSWYFGAFLFLFPVAGRDQTRWEKGKFPRVAPAI